jgi:phosphoglycerate dehydrogenase-like enzyme
VHHARTHQNLLLTPHIGGSTVDAWRETQRRVIDRAIAHFAVAGQ